MKCIKNDSLQGFEIYLRTEGGAKAVWLKPREVITVPEHYITEQVKTLHKRRLLKVYNA